MKTATDKEMELINRYTTSPLEREDVYIFTVTLCDNEVDRDFERFSTASLLKLGELFTGKTGISDHSMRSGDQRARIFTTYIEKDPSRKTTCGEKYTALKAKAYMLRIKENESFIKEIEGGIKKEISIGCSMRECICSICGKDMKKHLCDHIKGRMYSDKLCHGILSSAADAYEWSFVAVPAQRAAGVSKSFRKKEGMTPMTIEKFKSLKADTLISLEEMEALKAEIGALEKCAEDAQIYRDHLRAEIKKLSMLIMPSVNVTAFLKGCDSMELGEIKSLRDSMKAQAGTLIPLGTQLGASKEEKSYDNSQFKI